MTPVRARDAREVHFSGDDLVWLSVEQKVLFPKSKRMFRTLSREITLGNEKKNK
jgi:hypothetical protein